MKRHRITLFALITSLAAVAYLSVFQQQTGAIADPTTTVSNQKADRAAKHQFSHKPSAVAVEVFEEELFSFLNARTYVELGWKRDKTIRDTGPYLDGQYYGTHPAVRVFYSPEVVQWLEDGRRGRIPDGAMIIKEQYAPPAARHHGKTEAELRKSLESWTVMVKDSEGSHDGWFWSNPAQGQQVVNNHADLSHPLSGFGLYCIRCHASTRSPDVDVLSPANEYTFASLRNIEGYPGEPILFRVDDSWQKQDLQQKLSSENSDDDGQANKKAIAKRADGVHPACVRAGAVTPCNAKLNPNFAKFYDVHRAVPLDQVDKLPPVTHDWIPRDNDSQQYMVTSNQCMSCHAGLLKPFGPTMFEPAGENDQYGAEGWDISPYGEWRWTPMGLAGRDPIFLAQLESELAKLQREFSDNPAHAEKLGRILEDTCLKCHGAMGRHQFHADSQADDRPLFDLDQIQATANQGDPADEGDAKYGALAREGISCMVCHRMQPRPQPADDKRSPLEYYFDTSLTGNLYFGPSNEVYGPFKDDSITTYPMKHALGVVPKYSAYIKSSQLCGSCHTVALPSVDRPVERREHDELNKAQTVKEFADFHHHIEQATYLEWLNSEFENEFNVNNPKARSCQDCHMSKNLDLDDDLEFDQLTTRMAIIQDTTYPDAENLASHEDLNVRIREQDFARHNFSGLNLFLLELFDQFDDVLGVQTTDYMTGSNQAIQQARENFLRTARSKTASIALTAKQEKNHLVAEVVVNNKAGHRFPTGVGFRRAFIDLNVKKASTGESIWRSGATNSLGVLLDGQGTPLPSESFRVDSNGKQQYQPHYREITHQDQVQIYESLICNAQDKFTTSFIHGCVAKKDNRLLPRGWTLEGPGTALNGRYLEATHPKGMAAEDEDFTNGAGSDRVVYRIEIGEQLDSEDIHVECTLYYQAIPPYFLNNIFRSAPDSKAVQRLYFMLSHLHLDGTAIENWKLAIDSKTVEVDRSK